MSALSRGFSGWNPFAVLARHVRWKIILPFIGLSLIVSLAGTYLTTSVISGSLRERFENQLIEASRVTADSFALRERKHLESLRTVTFTNGVARAAAEGDSLALERLLLPIAVNSGIDRVEVVDTNGRLLYGVHRTGETSWVAVPLDTATSYQTWQPLQDVFSGARDGVDKSAGVVETQDGPALYDAGPLSFEGRPVGAVLIGSRLDSFLPAVKLAALGDVTLYGLDGTPLESTLNEDALGDIAVLAPSSQARAALDAGGAVRETRSFFGRDFDLLYATLSLRGRPAAVYSVALPSSFISSAATVTRRQMTALFSASTLAVMLIGWGVSRALMRPVVKLAETAQAVSDGDLGARSGVETTDEIGLLARTFDNMTGRLQRQRTATIRALASAIDARDPYTLGHSMRVGELAALIGQEMNLTSVQIQDLEIGGYLHDVGKIGVRDSVLLKRGALTDDERDMIEEHPQIGLRIVSSIELPNGVLDFIGLHHERLDGSGYPFQFKAEDVPLFARIGAVADMYDAMITERPYKRAMSCQEVLDAMLREAALGRIDHKVMKALEYVVPEWEARWRDDPTMGEAVRRAAIAGGGFLMMGRVFWPLFTVTAAGASVLLISSAASLALKRPAVQVFNVRIASAFTVDYSIDRPITIEPLSPDVIDAVLSEAPPSAAVRSLAPTLVAVQPAAPLVIEAPAAQVEPQAVQTDSRSTPVYDAPPPFQAPQSAVVSTAPQDTPPSASQPPVTAPPVTQPPVTQPPNTTAPVTQPPTTLPPVNVPPVNVPPVNVPPVNVPPVHVPPVNVPPVNVPPVNVPPVNVPPVNVPPVRVPPVTLPPVSLPPQASPPISLPPQVLPQGNSPVTLPGVNLPPGLRR